MAQNSPESIADVILHGLCIGCGLCEAVGGNRHKMRMTSSGSPRPGDAHRFSPQQEQLLLATCPGIAVEPRQSYGGRIDPVWGAYQMMCHAWAGDSEIRHQSAAGGVLTALACHLLNTGRVAFILHVRPDPEAAMRSVWTISETPQQALAAGRVALWPGCSTGRHHKGPGPRAAVRNCRKALRFECGPQSFQARSEGRPILPVPVRTGLRRSIAIEEIASCAR